MHVTDEGAPTEVLCSEGGGGRKEEGEGEYAAINVLD